jgi:hypothetical protein
MKNPTSIMIAGFVQFFIFLAVMLSIYFLAGAAAISIGLSPIWGYAVVFVIAAVRLLMNNGKASSNK